MNITETKDLTFRYESEADAREEKTAAIDKVSLAVEPGEYVAILGHNGSGKSTLAKLLNMILSPTSGEIIIDGVRVSDPDFSEDDMFSVREKIGMVFQNPDNQLVATLVEEDVAFGPENLGLPREEIRRRVDTALSMVGMTEYARHAPHKLSGGQKQRVAIAGTIAMKPRAIIFDESTAMLDPLGRREVVAIMEKLNKEEGITVLNITHYMDEAARADRVVVMDDGKIVMDGAPREIFARADELHALGLEAPQGVELVLRLRAMGLAIPGDPLTDDECTAAILSFFGKEAPCG